MQCQDGNPVHLIDSEQSFADAIAGISDGTELCLDTEFVRTNTFYPKVGLVQLADERCCLLVDPLPIGNWSTLKQLLGRKELTTVVHSCGEDLNLLNTALDIQPGKIFDTQVAASFLGLGVSLSYQALARELLGVEIAKEETRSDWLRRPLSETQLQYAASDVTYLSKMKGILIERLEQQDLLHWFEEDCERLLLISTQTERKANWQNLYANISNAWRLEDAGLRYLKRLCVWREQKARQRDKPRSWIAKDSDLFELANCLAQGERPTLESLQAAQLTDRRLLRRHGEEMLSHMVSAAADEEEIDRRLLNPPLTAAQRHTLKSLRSAVDERAKQLGLPSELLARKKLLIDVLRNFDGENAMGTSEEWRGWRHEQLHDAFSKILKRAAA